jgi:hypothetical protein
MRKLGFSLPQLALGRSPVRDVANGNPEPLGSGKILPSMMRPGLRRDSVSTSSGSRFSIT